MPISPNTSSESLTSAATDPSCGCPLLHRYDKTLRDKESAQAEFSKQLFSASERHKKFIAEYAAILNTNNPDQYATLFSKAPNELIRNEPASQLPSFKFPYVTLENGHPAPNVLSAVFSDVLFNSRGTAVITMPGAFTPVCSSMHLPSFLNISMLQQLKQSGLDVIYIVTGDTPDALLFWVRAAAAKANLSHVVPDALPYRDAVNRMPLHPTMPLIVPVADGALAVTNMLGVILPSERLDRLTGGRSMTLFGPDQKLRAQVLATTTSQEHCDSVNANALLQLATKHLRPAPERRLSI